MHALDERVLRDDEPAARAAPRRARRRRSARAARARRAGRAHRAARASSTACRSAGSVAARIDRDARRAGADARGGVRGVDAADRDHRDRDRGADRARAVEPERRIGVGLRRRRPDRADAEIVGVGRDRLLEASSPSGRAAAPRARARSAPRSDWPRCTPSAPSASAASTSSLTTNVAPSSRKPAPRATTSAVGRLHAQLHDRRAGRRPRGAPSRGRRRSRAPSRDPRPPVERRRVERGERVVERDVERARALRVRGRVLAGDAEGDERLDRARRTATPRPRGSSR